MKRFTQHNKFPSKGEHEASSQRAPGDGRFEESIFLPLQRVAIVSELRLAVLGAAPSPASSRLCAADSASITCAVGGGQQPLGPLLAIAVPPRGAPLAPRGCGGASKTTLPQRKISRKNACEPEQQRISRSPRAARKSALPVMPFFFFSVSKKKTLSSFSTVLAAASFPNHTALALASLPRWLSRVWSMTEEYVILFFRSEDPGAWTQNSKRGFLRCQTHIWRQSGSFKIKA